jgi:guanosine-3',5'-bis(diphosphate) 3'-pyrophosphohydrolase
MDEDDFDESGEFQTLEEAIEEAKKIVKNGILHLWQSGTKVDKLMNAWWDFGTDVSICSNESSHQGILFSARDFAEEFINEMSEQLKDDTENIQQIYQKTILFAADKHSRINQLVPGTDLPYIVHLSNVCMEVIIASQHTDNFNLKLAIQLALLHDVLEDTGTTKSELEEKFGFIIPIYVKALTKNKELPKEEQMADSLNRIKKLPKEVWAVKMADRITNLQPPPVHWSNEKIQEYLLEAVLICETLKGANQYLENRLKLEIVNYEKYINAKSNDD